MGRGRLCVLKGAGLGQFRVSCWVCKGEGVGTVGEGVDWWVSRLHELASFVML